MGAANCRWVRQTGLRHRHPHRCPPLWDFVRFSRYAKIVARGGLAEITGLHAVAVGIAYATTGVFIYVHISWDDHPYLTGFRDIARQLLLVMIIISLAATFGLALI